MTSAPFDTTKQQLNTNQCSSRALEAIGPARFGGDIIRQGRWWYVRQEGLLFRLRAGSFLPLSQSGLGGIRAGLMAVVVVDVAVVALVCRRPFSVRSTSMLGSGD